MSACNFQIRYIACGVEEVRILLFESYCILVYKEANNTFELTLGKNNLDKTVKIVI